MNCTVTASCAQHGVRHSFFQDPANMEQSRPSMLSAFACNRKEHHNKHPRIPRAPSMALLSRNSATFHQTWASRLVAERSSG